MPRLFLVRHGLSRPDPATPPETWGLDPDGLADIAALAASGRIPATPAWYSSGVHWFADPADFRAGTGRPGRCWCPS